MRSMSMRARPGLLLMYTMYCIYINIYVLYVCTHTCTTHTLHAKYGYARTTWSVTYLHSVLYLYVCVHVIYMYTYKEYEYTHVIHTRIVAMRAHNLVCYLSTHCIKITCMCICNTYVHICPHTYILHLNNGYALYIHIRVHTYIHIRVIAMGWLR